MSNFIIQTKYKFMPTNTPFQTILNKYRKYAPLFKNVWLWSDFPAKKDFGGKDTGIYLAAFTHYSDYWALQCKCQQECAIIDNPANHGAILIYCSSSSI